MNNNDILERILENQLAILNMLTAPYDDDSRYLALSSIRATLKMISQVKEETNAQKDSETS